MVKIGSERLRGPSVKTRYATEKRTAVITATVRTPIAPQTFRERALTAVKMIPMKTVATRTLMVNIYPTPSRSGIPNRGANNARMISTGKMTRKSPGKTS